ncbi:hypothetical protein E1B28_012214 [Marasmius oreades]|uniref:Uncharacterized protein n=1 Tax=Marasmius oreades TaxID=181124 RepID=A0A9P7RR88_9AGAR|nr:uncharacterized protein E1B28_012214 [Marasmius oreades]KAG7088197.1 hypothetical protein E1B28_012214 [Marasmius oreades]
MSASRRSSVSSISSVSSTHSLVGPESRLVLVHDNFDGDDNALTFEDSDYDDNFQVPVRTSSPPLSPSLVFLYLLSPHLKLGALLLPNVGLSLKIGLPALFLFAVLSAFARQIWFMLARYVRQDDLTDVVVDVFVRSRGKTTMKKTLKIIVLFGSGILRILLSVIFTRVSIGLLTPLFSGDFPFITPTILSVIVGFFLLPLCLGQSLSSKLVVYSTWASIVTFVLWFFCVTYAYSHRALEVDNAWLRMGALWQGIATIAYAFASSNTLALHASLRAGVRPSSSAAQKRPLSHSFKFLSVLSVSIALLFSIPLVIFAALPNRLSLQASRVQPFIVSLNAATLLLGVPSILVTVPKVPVFKRIRWRTSVPVSRLAVFAIVLMLANVPASVNVVLSDILIAFALCATYFLPALLHIINHFFRQPLSIVIPSQPSTPNTSSPVGRHSSVNDPLLLRKEQALQKKQWRRRIAWDLGVWTLLLPVGGGGFAWAIGTLFSRW